MEGIGGEGGGAATAGEGGPAGMHAGRQASRQVLVKCLPDQGM